MNYFNRFKSTNNSAKYLEQRYNLAELYMTLQDLGHFDKIIEVDFCDEPYFKVAVKAIDNDGTTFIFESIGINKIFDVIMTRESAKDMIVVRFYRKNALSKIETRPIQSIEPLNKEITFIRDLDLSNNRAVRYIVKKGDLEYIFSSSSRYDFDESKFKKLILEEELSFIKFIEIVKACFPTIEEEARHFSFSINKGNEEISRAIMKNNVITTFSLKEVKDNNTLTINLVDGELIETLTTIEKVGERANTPFDTTIEKTRRLVKGQN